MNTQTFQTKTHAKCILAGEHAVLRGCPALVFPIKNKLLSLTYQPSASLRADFDAPYGESLLTFFWEVMQAAYKLLNMQFQELTGKFFLENQIPMGSGMGFSSAISVAVTRWVQWKGWLNEEEIFEFARALEDNFHGKSSGIDIIGALTDSGVMFSIKDGIKDVELKWKPHLYLSASEYNCPTANCIKQVEQIWQDNQTFAEHLDHEMMKSVSLAVQALSLDDEQGLVCLTEAINMANKCFKQWGLISEDLQNHMDALSRHGAIAVKPTGSGGGGYVLSLWTDVPPKNQLPFEYISLF